jgi:hypothetical protein
MTMKIRTGTDRFHFMNKANCIKPDYGMNFVGKYFISLLLHSMSFPKQVLQLTRLAFRSSVFVLKSGRFAVCFIVRAIKMRLNETCNNVRMC